MKRETAVASAAAEEHGSPIRVGMLIGTISVSGGGVIEAVRALSFSLARQPGISVEVFSLKDSGPFHDFGGMPVHLAQRRGPHSFGYAPDLAALLRSRDLDILHVHGLWMYLSVAARQWHRETGRPYVVSPHGMLDPWALRHAGLKKRIALSLYEGAHLRHASCIHALCQQEAEAIAAAGLVGPVAVLPNGVEQPPGQTEPTAWRRSLPPEAKVLLFLGRITPKKRVVELVRAFTTLADQNWHLVLVGPVDPDYKPVIDAAIGRRPTHIRLVGPAYGTAREQAYASADAFILPSVSEGLPMAALEALAYGLPAVLTPQCNLPEAFEAGAALSIKPEEWAIAGGLSHLFSMGENALAMMGENGRKLTAERFSWAHIAGEMADLYRSLLQPQSPDLRRSRILRAGLPA